MCVCLFELREEAAVHSTHVTALLWVPLPVFLLSFLGGRGVKRSVGLHPRVQGQNPLQTQGSARGGKGEKVREVEEILEKNLLNLHDC